MKKNIKNYSNAIKTIKLAILKSRYQAVVLVNSEMLSLYFGVGQYISQNSREGFWGTNAIETIAGNLQKELPGLRGFSASNMKNMRLFYEEWSQAINSAVATANITFKLKINHNLLLSQIRQLSTAEFDQKAFLQIGFTQHREILRYCKNLNERLFYIQKCATEFWSVEKLKYNLKSKLFKKQGELVNNFNKTITNADLRKSALQSFKDEYLIDFVNIEDPDEMDEREFENEIVLNIKKFIMALGTDFSFMGNQYRLEISQKEYFIDLLFYNRKIQSLVAIELKRGEFKPEYAGKLNFYLSALDELVKLPHENPSIGIIFCKSQDKTIVEYAFRNTQQPMGVATYTIAKKLPKEYKNILPNAKKLEELING